MKDKLKDKISLVNLSYCNKKDTNTCSFATCSPDGVCPNTACCKKKGYDGASAAKTQEILGQNVSEGLKLLEES